MGHRRARPGLSVVHAPAASAPPPAARAPTGWLASLRDRKVVQWTLAYAAAAAALLQVLALVVAQFAWPEAVARSATVLLACGLPVAAVVAWYHGDRGAQRVGGVELLVLAAICALAAGLLWWTNSAPSAARPAAPHASRATAAMPRIAVLPLDNLSPDPANAFFADGLHDELLTALTRLGSVEVVSRTTMLGYREQRPPTRALAAELGATHLLEGTVRREGETVRLNVQLIDARSDRHLWAEAYTRRLGDALALQGEVAQAVADALRARIAPTARATKAPAAIDPRALDAYLQARAISPFERTDALPRRRALLDAALAIAPEFGAARAERASVLAQMHWLSQGDAAPLRAQAEADLAAAQRLEPDEPATAAAAVEFAWYFDRDLARALALSGEALARWPRSSQLAYLRSLVCRRLGRYAEALALNESAVRLDPRNDEPLLALLALRSQVYRDYEGALALSQRLLALKPSPENRRNFALDRFLLDGDLAARVAAYEDIATDAGDDPKFALERRWYAAQETGDWRAADALAAQWPTDYYARPGDWRSPIALSRLYYAVRLGDARAVRRHHAAAVAFLEREGVRSGNRDDALAAIAWANVLAGDPGAGRAEVVRGLRRANRETDRRFAAEGRAGALLMLAAVGERAAALKLLEASLAEPWGWHAADVVNDHQLAWAFGDDPGFAKLRDELRAQIADRVARWRRSHPEADVAP